MEEVERAQSQEDASGSVVEEPFVLQHDWQRTPEARGVINALLKRNKRRPFGKI